MTDQTDLRRLIARALHQYDNHHALSTTAVPGAHHYGEADAVLAVLDAEGIRDAARQAAGQPTAPRPALGITSEKALTGAAALSSALKAAQPSGAALTERRPRRAMSADGHEIVVTTDTLRLVLRQVGWLGQTGAFYDLDEHPLGDGHERGGVAPLYFPAHSDRLDDLMPDPTTADDPTPLRWGLGDVLHGDDDSVIVCLSGPDRAPYWLELDPDRAAALRADLTPPAAGLAAPTNHNTDLPELLAATLTERFTQLGNPGSAMRIQFKGPDGWPASRSTSPNDVAAVLRELLAAGAES